MRSMSPANAFVLRCCRTPFPLAWRSLVCTNSRYSLRHPRISSAAASRRRSNNDCDFGTSAVVSSAVSDTAATASIITTTTIKKKGKVLVLGGTGFLGQEVCQRAIREGYAVTSVSRRGRNHNHPHEAANKHPLLEYRIGDARSPELVENILKEDTDNGDHYVAVIHCVGLLLDQTSGLSQFNALASGSGSVPDALSTYDAITRLSAFHAINAVAQYRAEEGQGMMKEPPFPFIFTSAAEAGWPDVPGGSFVEENLAPDFLRRYLQAKRAVESKLLSMDPQVLRPVIMRPSLIYALDRPASYVPVGAFFVGNAIGLPFVDRPVSVHNLAASIVKAVGDPTVRGILRYPDIDRLASVDASL